MARGRPKARLTVAPPERVMLQRWARRHKSAQARNAKKEAVRRLLLSRTGYHLYYQVNAEAGRVEVLALWHSRRGREPSI
jgi:plasmid stabilization system protein ParE